VTILSDTRAAVGFPDTTSLRFLLDELRDSLSRTGSSALLVPSAGFEDSPVLHSLRKILLAVERDPSPRGLMGGGVATLFAGDRLASIRSCLDRLPGLLLDRVQRTLVPKKISVLQTLLRLPIPDFLGMCGLSMHENTHSSVLAWLLDPRTAPTIGPATLTALAARLENREILHSRIREAVKSGAIAVQRECPVAEEGIEDAHPGRVDLVVWGPNFVLAIENKVLAREHGEQTTDYWEWLEALHIEHAGIFLSPAGLPATSRNFKPVSYLELLSCLLEGPVRAKPEPAEELVLASYLKTLATGLLRAEFRAMHQGEERVQ
jgi:PD-(D/E)XK nuclease superfamily